MDRNQRRRRLAAGASAIALAAMLVAMPPSVRWMGEPLLSDYRALADDGGGSDGGGHEDSGEGGGSGSGGGGDDSGSGSGNSGPGGGESGEGGEGGEGGENSAGGDSSRAQSADPDRRAIAGEVIVIDGPPDLEAQAVALGFRVIEQHELAVLDITVVRFGLPRGLSRDEAEQELRRVFPDIQIADNSIYEPSGQVVLPAPDYARRLLGWTPETLACARGFRIGIVDTGIDVSAPGLAGQTIDTRSFVSALAPESSPAHGTAVAEILAGETANRAPLIPRPVLMNAAIFEEFADGSTGATAVAFAEALDWLVGEGVRLANVSLAGGPNPLISLAIDRASARGVLLLAAVGNGGPEATPAWPAAHPAVIAVTAIGPDAGIYEAAGRGPFVDVAAPGVGIWSGGADGSGRFDSGTSFAVPFVTAAAAAWLAEGGMPLADEFRAALATRVRDLGPPGRDPAFGQGMIQLANSCD